MNSRGENSEKDDEQMRGEEEGEGEEAEAEAEGDDEEEEEEEMQEIKILSYGDRCFTST